MFSRRRSAKHARAHTQQKAGSSALHHALAKGGGTTAPSSGETELEMRALLLMPDASAATGA